MTKRLLLSLTVITMALAAVAGATAAYFTDGVVLGSAETPNVFATGSVDIDRFNVTNLQVTGLAPGVPVKISNIGVKYIGNISADLYVGAGGESGPGDDAFIAPYTKLVIYKAGTSDKVFNGLVSDLSTKWQPLVKDATYGWYYYDLEFTLDENTGNDKQDVTNTDTVIMVYAVQSGGATLGTPYEIDVNAVPDWFDL